MFSIMINEKGGEQKRLEFDKPEVTIGRVTGNDIILPKGNVSKRHSRIVLKDGKFIIVDLKSTNGTYVNGRKITSPLVVKGTDKIYIGDFILTIDDAGAGQGASPPAEEPAAPARPPGPPPPPRPTKSSLPAPPPGLQEQGNLDLSGSDDDGGGEAELQRPTSPPRPTTPPIRPSVPPAEPARPEPMISRPEPARPEPARPEPARPEPARPEVRPSLPTTPAVASFEAPTQGPMAAVKGADSLRPIEPPSRPSGPSTLDRPVVAQDRISNMGTMAATEAPQRPSLPPPSAAAVAAARPQAAPRTPATTAPSRTVGPRSTLGGIKQVSGAPADDPQRRRRIDLLNNVVPKALEALGLATLTAEHVADSSLGARVENSVGDLVDRAGPLPPGIDADALTKDAVAEIIGAGPLDELMNDETVHEIAVTSHDRVYVDRGSGQALSDKVFSSPQAVARAITRLSMRAAGKIDGTLGEMRLDNGALLQVALPPNARVPSLILRRARRSGGRLGDLTSSGVLSPAMSEFLEVCMRERRNLMVSGYGRVVMLGALGGATAAGARVVTVEPVSELDLSTTSAAWIGLIARGSEVRQVIGHAVRLHPDHLVITDVRGPEALDVAAALCGGQGVVVGVDAASARDAIARIESLGRLSGESPPRKALREELAQALHLCVHVGRTASGAYRVMEISEVTLAEEGGVELVPMFIFKPEGQDGHFVATGHVPAFAG